MHVHVLQLLSCFTKFPNMISACCPRVKIIYFRNKVMQMVFQTVSLIIQIHENSNWRNRIYHPYYDKQVVKMNPLKSWHSLNFFFFPNGSDLAIFGQV